MQRNLVKWPRSIAAAILLGGALAAVPSAPSSADGTGPIGADFNGDGYADLVIGAAWDDIGGVDRAGSIRVLYGSAQGAKAAGSQMWHQGVPGVPGSVATWNWFGDAIATGDFDADGFDDLAVGAPRYRYVPRIVGAPVEDAGSVNVFYGTAAGLTTNRAQLFTQATPGVPGAPANVWFGARLATGDFDGDGDADLAVGAGQGTGSVVLLDGSPTGIVTTGAQHLLGSAVAAGEPIIGFGTALAAGDFDGNGKDDLAVGAKWQDVGAVESAGRVYVVGGGNAMALPGLVLDQVALPGDPADGAEFGGALAAGRLGNDGFADLAVGAHYATVGGAVDVGAVVVLRGSASGLAVATAKQYSYATDGVAGDPTVSDRFGSSLAIGDLTGDGLAELSIGVTGRDTPMVASAGEVVVLRGNATALTTTKTGYVRLDSPGVPGDPAVSDWLGVALTVVDANGDGNGSLAIGVLDRAVNGVDQAGAVVLVPGGAPFPPSTGSRVFTAATNGIAGDPVEEGFFGASLG